jgi:site-specific recombinase XerD
MAAASAHRLRLAASAVDPHVASFVQELGAAGYVADTVHQKRRIATTFVAWLGDRRVSVLAAEEGHVAAFLHRAGRRRRARRAHERAAVRGFLHHLSGTPAAMGRRHLPDPVPLALASQYVDFLLGERGLSARSADIYGPYVEAFLQSPQGAGGDGFHPHLLEAQAVRDYLLDRTRGRSSAYAKLVATCLRARMQKLGLDWRVFRSSPGGVDGGIPASG